jgi:hypothetical protein
MAKVYFEKLSEFIRCIDIEGYDASAFEVKHFFSGAALYFDGTLCVSLSPVGLAFKLPENEVEALINNGKAVPLKYFPRGHVKKGYALFEDPNLPETASSREEQWVRYLLMALEYANDKQPKA